MTTDASEHPRGPEAGDAPQGASPGPGLPPRRPGTAALWNALDQVTDPHIPASLVELGMIHDLRLRRGAAKVEMTYPCLGCPAYGFLQTDVRDALEALEGVDEVAIDVVWEPGWSKDRLAPDVREKIQRWGVGL